MAKGNARNKAYWLRRAEVRKAYMESLWPRAARTIAKEYQQAAYQMQDRINAFYGRFGTTDAKGNIIVGFQDAMKALPPGEARIFKERAKAAAKKYAGTPDEPFKAALAQYGRAVTVPRFMLLELDSQIIAHDAAIAQLRTTAGALSKNALIAYYYTVTEIEAALGVGIKYGAMNARQVRGILMQNWTGKEFSTRIWDDRLKLANDLKRVMVDGFSRRRRNSDMAKDLAERFDVSYANAERLVRTESAHVVEQATFDSYAEAGVEEYEFSAILDERTSDICEGLDGDKFKLSAQMVGVNAPPMHPNCRSTTLPLFDGVRTEAADAKPEYSSYAAWKADNEKNIDRVAKEAAEPWAKVV
jgi:SPP1 gp7 family putative phage head morphogenesis protein